MGIIMDLLFGRKLTPEEIQKRENEYWNKVITDRNEGINYMIKEFENVKTGIKESSLSFGTQELEKKIAKINRLEDRTEMSSEVYGFLRYLENKEFSYKVGEYANPKYYSNLNASSSRFSNPVNFIPTRISSLKEYIESQFSDSTLTKNTNENQLNNMIEEDFKAEEFKDIKSKEIDNELSLLEQRKAELEARIVLKKAEKEYDNS